MTLLNEYEFSLICSNFLTKIEKMPRIKNGRIFYGENNNLQIISLLKNRISYNKCFKCIIF